MKYVIITLLASILIAQASEEGAARELARYERSAKAYQVALKNPDGQIQAELLKPDAKGYANRIINQMRGQGRKAWIVPYIAWIFNYAPDLELKQADGLRAAFEKFHLRSPDAGQVAMALINRPDPMSLSIAEKVLEKHPDVKEQGLAALAIAIMIGNLGDEPRIMDRKLKMLRKAIIDSADVKVGDRLVSDIAENELFVMNNLTKGRKAPNIVGKDIRDEPLSLARFSGQVVVLTFWGTSAEAQGADAGAWMAKVTESYAGKPVSVLGVTAVDPMEVRKLVAAGVVTWKNFIDSQAKIHRLYRIKTLPLTYILDQKGEIKYIGVPGAFAELTVDALLADAKPEN